MKESFGEFNTPEVTEVPSKDEQYPEIKDFNIPTDMFTRIIESLREDLSVTEDSETRRGIQENIEHYEKLIANKTSQN